MKWEQYKAMPYILMNLLPDLPQSHLCSNTRASFCKDCTGEGKYLEASGDDHRGSIIGKK